MQEIVETRHRSCEKCEWRWSVYPTLTLRGSQCSSNNRRVTWSFGLLTLVLAMSESVSCSLKSLAGFFGFHNNYKYIIIIGGASNRHTHKNKTGDFVMNSKTAILTTTTTTTTTQKRETKTR